MKKIENWPIIKQLLTWSQATKMIGFHQLSVYEVVVFLFQSFTKSRLVSRASAISFQFILALAPTIILLFTLIPYIPIDNFQEDLIKSIEEVLPDSSYKLVEGTITDLIAFKHNDFLSISFLLGIYYASNSIMGIFEGFSGSYHLEVKLHPLRTRLIAILLVFFLPIFIFPAFLTITLSETVLQWLLDAQILRSGIEVFLVLAIKWIVVLLFFNLAISILYNIGDGKNVKWRFISTGSATATIAFILVSQGFAFYVNNFGNYNKFYGSLGTIVVLLLWIHFNFIILLVGFEINAVVYKAKKRLKEARIISLE